MKEKQEYIYEGFMSDEAQEFFEGNIERDSRDGVAVSGSFVKLANGNTHLPNKGDIFTKWPNGVITVKSIHR